jgi:hypothetical protein
VEATASSASTGSVFSDGFVGVDCVVLDDALATEQPQDARLGDLQDVGNVAVGETGQRMERELAVHVLVLVVDTVQTERVEMGIESQIRAHALHDGDGAALAVVDTTRREVCRYHPSTESTNAWHTAPSSAPS